jgi:hypothetical protein
MNKKFYQQSALVAVKPDSKKEMKGIFLVTSPMMNASPHCLIVSATHRVGQQQ